MAKMLAGLLGVVLCVLVWLPLPVQAASSSAIRPRQDIGIAEKNFRGQNLQQAEFMDIHLENADFGQADLRGVVFNGATVTGANFQGVDMTDGLAYLSDFTGANFTNAVLNAAIMLKSTFRDVVATGADFSDAVLEKDQIALLCQSASGTKPVTGVETRESLGCP
ncbi:MAG: pentapeptide repeat-containing protein [Thermosynechococcaceae cyanobacterium]